jgi:hypothetical protein
VSSQIIETNPTSGSATTSSVRDNFGFAKTEINELQRMTEDRVVTSGDYDVQVADFANNVTLAEGVRILIEVGSLSGGAGSANDTTTPTLNVDSTGAKTIVRQDGSALVAGDLKAGQYLDLIYDATATKWVWLNSPYAQLITSLKQDIAANIYPVGSIFTTTTNYSDASNGAAVTTALGMASTVQWSRYAKGRTIVGFDSGYTPSAATASADDVIQLTFTASEGESGQLHPFGVGDTITTSGFTTSQANVTNGTVTEATANTIKYASSSSISSGATVTIGSGKVVNTAMDVALEAGGASNHVLSQAEMNHNHQWNKTESDSGGFDRFIEMDGVSNSSEDSTFDESGNKLLYTDQYEMRQNTYTSANRGLTGGTITAHNNLQPYITTYIWKRTA